MDTQSLRLTCKLTKTTHKRHIVCRLWRSLFLALNKLCPCTTKPMCCCMCVPVCFISSFSVDISLHFSVFHQIFIIISFLFSIYNSLLVELKITQYNPTMFFVQIKPHIELTTTGQLSTSCVSTAGDSCYWCLLAEGSQDFQVYSCHKSNVGSIFKSQPSRHNNIWALYISANHGYQYYLINICTLCVIT